MKRKVFSAIILTGTVCVCCTSLITNYFFQNKNGVLKLQKQFFIKNNPNQSASIEQDLIEDDFCKMSTSIDEKKTTPTSIYSVTSLPKTPISNDIMDVSDSDINNTASIGITRSYTMNRFLEKEFRTDDDNRFGKQEWNINEAQENICKQNGESNHNSKHLNYDKTNVNGCCVVYQHRLSDDDDCSDRDDEPQIYLSSNQSSFYINAPKMSEENKAFTHNQLVNNDIRKTNPSSLIEGNNIKSYKICTSLVYQIKAPPIMLVGHHTKFSSKENILITHHKSDFLNKDIICKKFENTLNSKQSNEENSSSTIFKFNKYLGTTKVAFEKSGKPSYKMNVPPLVVSSSTNSFTSVENILIGNCNNIFAINSNTVSDISKIKIDPRHLSFIHRNEYSSDVDVSSTDTHDLSTKFVLKSRKEGK